MNDCRHKEDIDNSSNEVPIGNITSYSGTGTNHIVSIITPQPQENVTNIANLHDDDINNEIDKADIRECRNNRDTLCRENRETLCQNPFDLQEDSRTSATYVDSDQNNEISEDLQHNGANRSGSKTPVLRKIGEKTPPGTLKKLSRDRPTSSCKLWCEQYSQTFLAKTIDTPLPDPGSYSSDDDKDDETGH